MVKVFLRLAKPSARLDRLANFYKTSAPIGSKPGLLKRACKEVLGTGTTYSETGQTQCPAGPTSEYLQDRCTVRIETWTIEKGSKRGARQWHKFS
jgi:hypothetical protein